MSLGNKMFRGVVWSAIENISVKSIQFLIGILLARILTPHEYGIIGILTVFIMVSAVFIDSGFTKALIHKNERTSEDISTVFVFNLAISVLAYLILYFASPYIEAFYKIESLALFLRVLAVSLISNAAFTVPMTLLTIKLDFKTLTKINLISSILAGLGAVYLALHGYGVWALVIQTITKSVLTAILVYFRIKWKPSFVFSVPSFKSFFAYGSNLLISSILNRIVSDMSSIFIAKYLTAQNLGYYTRGVQFNDFVAGTVSTVLDRVLLPGLVSIQNNLELLVTNTKQILKITTLLTAPIFLGLFVLAKPIILILLTEKWLMAVPIMQIFCLARFITIISGISINLLYVIGKPNLVLKQQYFKIPIRLVLLLISLKYGIVYIAISELISTMTHFFINTHYPGKIMNYGALKQIKDLVPILIPAVIMAITVHFAILFIENDMFKIVVGLLLGALIYVTLIFFLQRNLLQFLVVKINDLKK